MYSALVKLSRAFMHSLAVSIAALLLFLTITAALGSIVEAFDMCGNQWAHRVVVFFEGGE